MCVCVREREREKSKTRAENAQKYGNLHTLSSLEWHANVVLRRP
jgi:hypothetical protein